MNYRSRTCRFYFKTSIFLQDSLKSRHKRLRIAIKKANNTGTSIATYAGDLEATANSNDALQILIHISDALQYTDEDISESLPKLSEHFRREKQSSAVRVKILALLSECITETGVLDEAVLIDEILLLIKTEPSAKVVSQGLHSLYKIGNHLQLASAILAKYDAVAKQQLLSHSHNIQKHALLLLGAFAPINEVETLSLVGKYTDSQDSRVRAQAFRSILMLGARGVLLTPSLYARAIESLNDDYECVRKEALQLVFELGVRHPEQ